MFWKQLFYALPLTFSESTSMDDISQRKILQFFGWLFALPGMLPLIATDAYLGTNLLDRIFPYWTVLMAYLTTQTGGNMVLKYQELKNAANAVEAAKPAKTDVATDIIKIAQVADPKLAEQVQTVKTVVDLLKGGK